MPRRQPITAIRSRRRVAFSLLEATVCSLLVSLVLVVALSTVASARLAETRMGERARGAALGEELLGEIVTRMYEDPDVKSVAFGPDAGELKRMHYDDVDDYHGLNESPPAMPNGAQMVGLTGWSRRVQVAWVAPNAGLAIQGSESLVKRITVQVFQNGRLVSETWALQSRNALNQVGRDNAKVVLQDPAGSESGAAVDGGLTIRLGGLTLRLGGN